MTANRSRLKRSHDQCVEELVILVDGRLDLMLTLIGRKVCRMFDVWPEQLVGFERVGNACSWPDDRPVSIHDMRSSVVVEARRWAWWAARRYAGYSPQVLGESFGGHAATTVKSATARCPGKGVVGEGIEAELKAIVANYQERPQFQLLEGRVNSSIVHLPTQKRFRVIK